MSLREKVFVVLFINEPVVSHDEPWAAVQSSVDWDVFFDPTQSNPGYYILFVLVFNFNRQQTHDWTLIGCGANGHGYNCEFLLWIFLNFDQILLNLGIYLKYENIFLC